MSYVSDRSFSPRYAPQPAADRRLSMGSGGAMIGAWLAGMPGLVVGGLFGLVMAEHANREDRRRESGESSAG